MNPILILGIADQILTLVESVGVSLARFQALRAQRKAEGKPGLTKEDVQTLADEADAARAKLPSA